jgi:major membrane immunogen (membrane-anchored lipoprotein)
MKARTIALTLAVCLVGVAVCHASDPNMGTWKLNEAKSKFPPGATKNTTVVYSSAGDMTKVTTDGTNGDGKPVQSEWTGKFDGKDYPVTGGSSGVTRSYVKVDDHTLKLTNKKDGKVTSSGRAVVSADGKIRTVNLNWTSDDGKKMASTAMYDKQ